MPENYALPVGYEFAEDGAVVLTPAMAELREAAEAA